MYIFAVSAYNVIGESALTESGQILAATIPGQPHQPVLKS
jgi:hypothetical protein